MPASIYASAGRAPRRSSDAPSSGDSSDEKNSEVLAPVTSAHDVYLGDRPHFYIDGKLQFVGETGANGGGATYQDAYGAPVETQNPLGYEVGWWSALFLNITMLIGTGIFSFPSSLLRNLGSVGLALVYWVIGWLISLSGISTYLEFASYFPSRSGADVVYLEQAYPRPKFFFPIAFAVQTVILSFVSSNVIVVSQYIFRMVDTTPTDWQFKGVGVAALTVITLPVWLSTKWTLRISNTLGVLKIVTLFLIIIPGFVALGGHLDKVPDPKANFRNAFQGASSNGYQLSNALVNIIFSYGGYNNSFNLVNEVKNPIQTIKRTANTAVTVVFFLYLLANVAFFAVLTRAEIVGSAQVTATVFWSKLFGERAARGLTILPVLSAASNILMVIIGQSRQIREIGRQGILPYPRFWVYTWPFGTPTGALAAIYVISLVVVLAAPAGDAFSFLTSMGNYPASFFDALLAVGLFFVRRHRKQLGLPRGEYRSWTFVVLFFCASKVFLLVMPWLPPPGGINGGAFSFFYASSSITGMGIVLACGLYYFVWARVLPKWGKYSLRQTVVVHEDGAVSHQMIKISNDEIEAWDAKHDPSGRSIDEQSARA